MIMETMHLTQRLRGWEVEKFSGPDGWGVRFRSWSVWYRNSILSTIYSPTSQPLNLWVKCIVSNMALLLTNAIITQWSALIAAARRRRQKIAISMFVWNYVQIDDIVALLFVEKTICQNSVFCSFSNKNIWYFSRILGGRQDCCRPPLCYTLKHRYDETLL